MATLKELRTRINSVKATQKITSAMKMVAASKLRRAQEAAEAARPYAERMERMVRSIADSLAGNDSAPAMLAGTGQSDTHLVIVATSDRGLCGGFNSSIVRAARQRISELLGDGKTVKLLLIGRKAGDQLRREHADKIVGSHTGIGTRGVTFAEAATIADEVARWFEDGAFDVCTIYYNHFQSAVTQIVTPQQLIPFASDDGDATDTADSDGAIYEFEPSEEEILEDLLPRNMAVQIFHALLENAASEQGARMMAMDNATRNAGEMIDKLSLTYNRSRQAVITKELIEIVSGAEAL
jgi:F-type H+-transporting ATPase subunit gamma